MEIALERDLRASRMLEHSRGLVPRTQRITKWCTAEPGPI